MYVCMYVIDNLDSGLATSVRVVVDMVTMI